MFYEAFVDELSKLSADPGARIRRKTGPKKGGEAKKKDSPPIARSTASSGYPAITPSGRFKPRKHEPLTEHPKPPEPPRPKRKRWSEVVRRSQEEKRRWF